MKKLKLRGWNQFFGFSLLIISLAFISPAENSLAKEIVHDAEFYVLKAQHGQQWAAEDKEIEQRLDELRQKHGKRPNIVHIMWDDMSYGAIGHPMLNKVSGYTSPIWYTPE